MRSSRKKLSLAVSYRISLHYVAFSLEKCLRKVFIVALNNKKLKCMSDVLKEVLL